MRCATSGRALSPELQVPSTTSKKQFLNYQPEEQAKAISQVSHASQVKLRMTNAERPESCCAQPHTHCTELQPPQPVHGYLLGATPRPTISVPYFSPK